ncbi:FYVE and coiled-coil domain-containing protein 1 [Microdochium nivale]|nr:FYVE and coiled-coil domain-containing protein 1 [Microdochium nivale]
MANTATKSGPRPARQPALTASDQRLHDLEVKYLQHMNDLAILNKDEDIRRLRVQNFLLGDDNSILVEQIALNDTANAEITAERETLVVEIEEQLETILSQESQIRRHERDFAQLNAELQSMTSVTKDSANLLAEKLALSREVAVLKPEIEHLRSQVNHQQSTLAEKLSLERQVNTLEVELANEKKATKRVLEKRESIDRVEDELRKKLRDAEKRLTTEKAERERIEDQLENERRHHQFARDSQDTTRESESDLRKKLQDMQKQLRQAKEESERIKDEMETQQNVSKKANKKAAAGTAVEEELRTELSTTQAKLEAVLKDKSNYKAESDKAVAEAESNADAQQRKFEKLKTKFRELQEELKQSKADLRAAQLAQAALEEDLKKRNPAAAQTIRTKKGHDNAHGEFSQITIQTPGAYDPSNARRGKKPQYLPTRLGEKSDFTITPFLNRSKDLEESNEEINEEPVDSVLGGQRGPATIQPQPSSPQPEEAPAEAADVDDEQEPEQAIPVPKPRGRPKKTVTETVAKEADDQPAPKAKSKKRKSLEQTRADAKPFDPDNMPLAKKPKVKLAKSKVAPASAAADKDDEDNDDEPAAATTAAPSVSASAPAFGDNNTKKRRRNLGTAKTLFDEDDGEIPAVEPVAATAAAAVRVPMSNTKRAKTHIAGVQNAFAGASTFSPLKRHRRGVGASFLA